MHVTQFPDNTVAEAERELAVSVVIPCLNEAANIEECVRRARQALERSGIAGEVVVADNGSDDGSELVAREAGAQVVHEPRRGYGSAYLAGFSAARGEYIVMADADLTYDFAEIPRFVEGPRGRGRHGHRRPHGQHPSRRDAVAAPLRRATPCSPARSTSSSAPGSRTPTAACAPVRRTALPALDLRTTGMEFASEMVIRAAKANLDIRQVPIEYHPRGGQSKLSSFRDGWRHLRFLLVHSPTHLFVIPGAAMAFLGSLAMLTVLARLELARAPVGLPLPGRGCAPRDRRDPDRLPGPVRSRLRHLFHGRRGSLVRPHAQSLQARARAAGGGAIRSPALSWARSSSACGSDRASAR